MLHTTQELNKRRTLTAQLQQLKSQNGDQYDQPRFHFIESLLNRSNKKNRRVCQLLESKAKRALNTYQAAWSAAKAKAETQLADIKIQFPEIFEQAQSYVEQGDFTRLNRYLNRYTSRDLLTHQPTSPLTELTNSLTRKPEKNTHSQFPSLNEVMYQQEAKVVQATEPKSNVDQKPVMAIPSPLKANLRYQRLQRKRQVDHFMALVMKAKPSNPGPLNPENLAIELLQKIYALSPEYLTQYLTNVETLIWLEKIQNTTNKK